ncbi:MAG TPA: SRPBCC domain-containing protein [Gaiellaceae bacterium]|nr:SRPBCC domain-containing protein [Gaiellaceae bacterium]
MEQTTDRVELRRELEIAASPETVWGFLVDPAKSHIWWGKAVSFEPRAGSPLRIEINSQAVATGEILEADPPRRLVYTWGWELGGAGPELVPPGSTTVEIDLEPSGSGTILRLVHRDLPDEKSAAEHGAGWDHYLGRLATAAAGGDPGPDPWGAAHP